jgi:hypothetical protein
MESERFAYLVQVLSAITARRRGLVPLLGGLLAAAVPGLDSEAMRRGTRNRHAHRKHQAHEAGKGRGKGNKGKPKKQRKRKNDHGGDTPPTDNVILPTICQCFGEDNDGCEPNPIICGVCCRRSCCMFEQRCCNGDCCVSAAVSTRMGQLVRGDARGIRNESQTGQMFWLAMHIEEIRRVAERPPMYTSTGRRLTMTESRSGTRVSPADELRPQGGHARLGAAADRREMVRSLAAATRWLAAA